MSDHDRICAKLDKLQTYYTELKSLSSISLNEYISNSIYRRAIERTCEKLIEMLEINLVAYFPEPV